VVTRVPELEASQQRAAELADAGEYAEALRLHRTYFAVSRGVTRLYGVRLSFALKDWLDARAPQTAADCAIAAC
jgi:hypothetical protein